ncbi:hypothetical protein EV127DRAFT_498933 [Xylaria flabelliformis]|nr:hypothetical protein EV127DRAFT_498933 [Xylaria flabelliformis]
MLCGHMIPPAANVGFASQLGSTYRMPNASDSDQQHKNACIPDHTSCRCTARAAGFPTNTCSTYSSVGSKPPNLGSVRSHTALGMPDRRGIDSAVRGTESKKNGGLNTNPSSGVQICFALVITYSLAHLMRTLCSSQYGTNEQVRVMASVMPTLYSPATFFSTRLNQVQGGRLGQLILRQQQKHLHVGVHMPSCMGGWLYQMPACHRTSYIRRDIHDFTCPAGQIALATHFKVPSLLERIYLGASSYAPPPSHEPDISQQSLRFLPKQLQHRGSARCCGALINSRSYS